MFRVRLLLDDPALEPTIARSHKLMLMANFWKNMELEKRILYEGSSGNGVTTEQTKKVLDKITTMKRLMVIVRYTMRLLC